MEHLNILSSSSRPRTRYTKLFLALTLLFSIAGCSEKTAEDSMQEAVEYSEKGDPKAAVVALKNAVQEAPRLDKARFELGKTHLKLNNFDEASKELSRALEYGYAENKVIPLLAEALTRSGANVAMSELTYQGALLTPAEQLEVGSRKVAALLELDKWAEASVLIDELLVNDMDTPYRGMIEGYQFVIAKNYPEALNTIKLVLEKAPLNRDVISFGARLYILNGDIENATNLYENYIKVAEDDLQAKFALVNILMQQQQSERAEKYIDELLAINMNNGMLNQLKATARAAANDHEAAKRFAEKAINSGRGDITLRLIAGFSSYNIQDFEGTIRHLTVVAGLLPDEHPALRMLADSQLHLDMGEDAALVLSRVNNITPDDLSLFSRTSYELIKAGDTDSAEEMIEQAQKVTESSEDLVRLGALKLTLNNLEGVADLERAVAQSPDSVMAKNTLAGAYLATKKLDKAMALAKQWQKDQPGIVEGYLLEADVLSTQQKFDEATKAVDKASSIDPTNAFAQLASIRLDMIAERYEQGLVKADKLLAQEPNNVQALASYFKIKNELGDASQAIEKIETAANKDIDNEPLTILYASILVSEKKFIEAIDVLNKVDANRLTPSTFWGLKGIALYNTSNLADSYTHYTKWAGFFPTQVDPTLGLLNVLDLQRKHTEAATVAANFLAEKDNLQIQMMESYFLAMSGNAAGAKQSLGKVGRDYQELPYIRGVKARVALLEGRGMQGVDDAKSNYMAKKSPDNLILYVQTLDAAGQTPQAFPIIQQHVKDFPNDARSKALFAERKVASDPTGALATYEEMLKEFPDSPVLLNNAGYLHYLAKNMEKAYEYSSKAYKLNPTNLEFSDTYAQILMHRGETEQAVEAYNLAITDTVNDETIILNYIEALLTNNNKLAGKRRIQQFNSKLKTQEAKDRLFNLQVQFLN